MDNHTCEGYDAEASRIYDRQTHAKVGSFFLFLLDASVNLQYTLDEILTTVEYEDRHALCMSLSMVHTAYDALMHAEKFFDQVTFCGPKEPVRKQDVKKIRKAAVKALKDDIFD